MANPCTVCGKPGIPGLLKGCGKCQYHYNVGQFGKDWADRCREGESMKNQITTQKEIRSLFWEEHPNLDRKKVNGDYKTDTRVAFCDFIEHLNRSGQINDALAQRATL